MAGERVFTLYNNSMIDELQMYAILSHYISTGGSGCDFGDIALALFRYQFTNNAHYRRLCEAYDRTPMNTMRWQEIPAVPIAAFRMFPMSCVVDSKIVKTFESSGTTAVMRGKHLLSELALRLYELSLAKGFALADRRLSGASDLWALMPDVSVAESSSLSHMLQALGATRYFWEKNHELDKAIAKLTAPISLFGTAFAFVNFFDESANLHPLPSGSLVVETGGFKGRSRAIDRHEFYRLLSERFAVQTDSIISEYGMCELASQFYGRGMRTLKRGPFWTRTLVVDPATGDELPDGEQGHLVHFDLANLNSIVAIQTQDLGRKIDDGFELLGRSNDVPDRGCSLMVEGS